MVWTLPRFQLIVVYDKLDENKLKWNFLDSVLYIPRNLFINKSGENKMQDN